MACQTPRGHVWMAQPYMARLVQNKPAGFLLVPAVPGTDISHNKSTLEVTKRGPRNAAPAPGVTRETPPPQEEVYVLPPAPMVGLGSPLGTGFDLMSPLAPERLSKEEKRRLRMEVQANLANIEGLYAKADVKKEKFETKFKFPAAPRAAPAYGAPPAAKRKAKPKERGGYLSEEEQDYYATAPPSARPARDRRPVANGSDIGYEPTRAVAQVQPARKVIKRPPLPPPPELPPPRGPREAKQRHVDAARAKRNAELLKVCAAVLTACKKKKPHNVYFAVPVDYVTMGIADYPEFVKNPMDYATVEAKMKNQEYNSPLEFKADMELIYSNCALYNKAEDAAGQAGIAASEFFADEWESSGIETKMANEVMRRCGEDAEVAALPEEGDIPPELLREPGAPVPKPPRDREAEKLRRQEKMAAERAAAAAQPAMLPARRNNKRQVETDSEDDTDDSEDDEPQPQRKRAATERPPQRQQQPRERAEPPPQRPRPQQPQRPTEKPPSQRAPMKFEQKRQLSVALANLPIARQARVVQIISVGQTQDDEIEIDLDQMDNTTLWRLFDYVFPKSQQIAMGITHDDLVAPAAAPGAAAAAPPPAASKPAAKPAASSSDSSDTDSSSDDDDKPVAALPTGLPPGSEGGDSASGKAKEAAAGALPPSGLGAPLLGPPAAPAGGDVAMANAAPAPAILADVAVRKEVTIQNASSWANFAAQGDAGTGATTPGGNGHANGGEAAIPEALWSEFARKEAEKAAREKERTEAEARLREAREREEADREAAVAKAKADAEAAEAAARAAAEAEEARRVAEREAARERARAELQNVDQTVNLDEQRAMMEEMGSGGAYGGFAMPAFPGMDIPAPPPPAPAGGDAEMEEGEV